MHATGCCPLFLANGSLTIPSTAIAIRSASGAPLLELQRAIELESHSGNTYLYRLCLLHEVLFHDILETINLIRLVGVCWLIQSHCKGRTRSSSLV